MMKEILTLMVKEGASDLHIKVGSPPTLRIYGKLIPLDMAPLTPQQTKELIYGILTEDQKTGFEEELELDMAYTLEGISRFRVNVYQQRRSLGAIFRLIPLSVRNMEELRLPASILKPLLQRQRGLFIVTGPTGSGKSTTLSAMIDYINNTERSHIITLEDPIEYVYQDKMSIINQRELNVDTHSFASALKHVLRQDPDVIMVGEMRDLETMALAITAAETGHMVMATMHTNGSILAIERLIESFPISQQSQIRVQLSLVLEGVMSQLLLARMKGPDRIVATELLIGTPAVRNLIREGKLQQMVTLMHTGMHVGMQTMDQALKILYQSGEISYDEALSVVSDSESFKRLLGR